MVLEEESSCDEDHGQRGRAPSVLFFWGVDDTSFPTFELAPVFISGACMFGAGDWETMVGLFMASFLCIGIRKRIPKKMMVSPAYFFTYCLVGRVANNEP